MAMAIKLALIALCSVALCSGKFIESSPFENEIYPYPKIVGGAIAEDRERPEVVAIRTGFFSRTFICGGSLLTPNTVLTAAHCNDAVIGALRVYISAGHNRHDQGREYRCHAYLNHPNWNSLTTKSDVGLLFTAVPVVMSPGVSTAVLHRGALEGGENAVHFGWGRIWYGGPISSALKKLSTTTLTHEECVASLDLAQETYPFLLPHISKEEEICTFHSHGNGACHGDSGSPLVLDGTDKQVGLVSWGVPCAIGGPDVFVRLSSFIDWIEANTV